MPDYLSSAGIVSPNDWVPENSMIKVLGVGGGGCNAVTYMYEQRIQGCNFIVCNTDEQALMKSSVPVKIQLGDGLGAGTVPAKARKAALESQDLIAERVLDCGTKMLFITAGLGGGTGTGASPVIAKMAKDRGILTVAVVTLPFKNEGKQALSKASDGIHELEHNVDSLLIINNEKLYSFFGSELVQDAFPKADEILATAVRGIIEIIKKPGFINVDFQDVITMMKNSGMALMGCGSGSGPTRLEDAVKEALESPLLNDFDLSTAKNLLVNVTAGNNKQGLTMQQFGQISDLIAEYTGIVDKSKRGLIWDDDPDVGDRIHITVIATGFNMTMTELTGNDYGKLIMIDKDFTYVDEYKPKSGEIVINDEVFINKVSYNTAENMPHFVYDTKPALLVSSDQEISELLNTPAIRRTVRVQKQD
ncbi:MAG: cell division protein FtsZ [Candidatus Cryptobacteroides sp.]|nr:cell division protein FtsZ [Bacteroidales bacterium]